MNLNKWTNDSCRDKNLNEYESDFHRYLEKSFKTRDWEVIKMKAIVTFYDFLINIKRSGRARAI